MNCAAQIIPTVYVLMEYFFLYKYQKANSWLRLSFLNEPNIYSITFEENNPILQIEEILRRLDDLVNSLHTGKFAGHTVVPSPRQSVSSQHFTAGS